MVLMKGSSEDSKSENSQSDCENDKIDSNNSIENNNNYNATQTKQAYREKLAEDPSYVPRFGDFWVMMTDLSKQKLKFFTNLESSYMTFDSL
nr:4736_t:CDS:2 [Entrophospora candida]